MTPYHDLAWWWKNIRRMILVAGVLICLFTLGELLRLYQTLYLVHPWLAWTFVASALGGTIWLVAGTTRQWRSRPRILPDAPRLADLQQASEKELYHYRRALLAHGNRFLNSTVLKDKDGLPALPECEALSAGLQRATSQQELRMQIEHYEEVILQPVLIRLDQLADREIRESTADIITAVTISPWRSADLLVVLMRSTGMVLRISTIYGSRPSLSGQMLILRDVLRIVATVNLVGLGQRFMERLFSGIPFVGNAMDDLIQGFGAGYYANLAGHAARERCRSIQRWELREVESTLLKRMGRYASDLRKWLATDLGQGLWSRITRKLGGSPNTQDKQLEELKSSLDQVLAEMDHPGSTEFANPAPEDAGRSLFSRVGRWFG